MAEANTTVPPFMAMPTRRSVWIISALAGMAALFFILSALKPGNTEWLSAPPPNDPPHFRFLGRKWGWQASELWHRLIHGPYRTVAVRAHGMELDSLDFLTNFSRAFLQATNPTGDRFWVFDAPENPLDKLLNMAEARHVPEARPVSALDVLWREGHSAEISVQDQIPIGFSNQFVSVGWRLNLWMSLAQKDSVRLAFFTTASERDKARSRWVSNILMEVPVVTNAYFGARVTLPTNGTVFLLSGRTNAEGKYFGALLSPSLP